MQQRTRRKEKLEQARYSEYLSERIQHCDKTIALHVVLCYLRHKLGNKIHREPWELLRI